MICHASMTSKQLCLALLRFAFFLPCLSLHCFALLCSALICSALLCFALLCPALYRFAQTATRPRRSTRHTVIFLSNIIASSAEHKLVLVLVVCTMSKPNCRNPRCAVRARVSADHGESWPQISGTDRHRCLPQCTGHQRAMSYFCQILFGLMYRCAFGCARWWKLWSKWRKAAFDPSDMHSGFR